MATTGNGKAQAAPADLKPRKRNLSIAAAPAQEWREPAEAPAKPRKLTVANAVDQWAETTLAIQGLEILRKEAAGVLLAHAEKTGRRTFRDRIAVVQSGGSLILDQKKVREYLGARLAAFQTQTKLGWTLKLLK
jgi:hypothetical protein